ncbi:unnamed protein product [Arabis nemorensis]|uniref:Uncharacterized protein n=1 Tax=Arabis nemorensis TaxID=586526 RepID=A0A565BFS8_9BRAS|nr:unnamed protein product [Arabis nemorensis]
MRWSLVHWGILLSPAFVLVTDDAEMGFEKIVKNAYSRGDISLNSMAESTPMEIQSSTVTGPMPAKPIFKPLKAHEMSNGKVQFRKVSVPSNRYTPLKKAWLDIYTPVYDQMKIDIRMNRFFF